jgi:hypothetical protein
MMTSQRKILATIFATMITMSSLTITQIIPDSGDDIFKKVDPSEGNEDHNASRRGTKGPGDPLGFQPDLIVTSINRSMLFTDNQALTISGTISADIKNQGDVDTGANFNITFFEDSNKNGAYETTDNMLGSYTYSGILSAGTSTNVSTSVSGNVLFRDNLIYAFVDSNNVIAEDNETNNMRNTGQDCVYNPPTAAFNPILEWAWIGSLLYPGWNQVMCAPAVADLNQDGIPDIVFNTFTGPGYYEWNGILRAISGDGSMEIFSITDNNYRSAGCFNVAIGDIDNDDLPEIINLRHRYNGDEYRLMAFENDGTHKWLSNVALQVRPTAGATIADIDEDNIPEIIVGEYVFNNDGTLRWEGTGSDGLDISTVANLDMLGNPEIVAGNTAYHSDGAIYWQNWNVTEGRPAVGDFDSDGYPEVVVVGNGYIYMLEHNGTLKWGPFDIPPSGTIHDFGGPPTVGDFDGDGEAEIGVAGGYKYVVYEGNGTVKWSNETNDYSSSMTGSSVFDFEGDGSVEVIYADEYYLRIYNGTNGNVLWAYWLGSGTLLELPVIADVDNDNNAEIVMICNDYHPWGSNTGVYVFGDLNDNWVNTRKIWNQHTYHITNVNDNATIPQYEKNNWEIYNNFRCQALVTNLFAAPDLSACYIRVDNTSFPTSINITARIGNGGAISVIPGVSIAFYDGDPSAGGTLIGTIPTSITLAPGDYEDVTITWLSPVGDYHDFYVVADDNGTGHGSVSEWNELNNVWHYAIIISQILPLVPPTLYINVSHNGEDAVLYWDPPSVPGIDHYLIYRSTSQTNFDFTTVWKNTSIDKEFGETIPIPLRTMWNDTKAAFPGNVTNYSEQYYYTIRAVNILGEVSRTSRTVGKWTKVFSKGISTFSLPLEPIEPLSTDFYTSSMNANYIRYMNTTTCKWMIHNFGDGNTNDTQMKVGEGYEVKFASQTNYTFTGMPGAMISYDDNNGFSGFDHVTEAKNLTISVEPNGNVALTWEEPLSMDSGDWYEVYYSNTRDGFFRTFNVSYFLVCPPVYFGNNTTTHNGAFANNPGARLNYMVVPFNASGVRGASTYSIGIWTEEYLFQYDTFGIPLKLSSYQTADWYCENILETVGINYYNHSEQRWCWHSTRMPAKAFDPLLVMIEGYQISTSSATKFTFIGV